VLLPLPDWHPAANMFDGVEIKAVGVLRSAKGGYIGAGQAVGLSFLFRLGRGPYADRAANAAQV
jgi:hypothetical protein